MATATVETVEREHLVTSPPLRLSWGAIFGGTFAALGIWLLLYALGLALGLSSVEPSAPSSARGAGIFTGIWSVIAPLIALFVGGWVAARGAGVVNKMGGALHGLVMWGLTTVVGAWVLVAALGTVVGGIASVGKTAAQAAGTAAAGAAPSAAQNPATQDQLQDAARSLQQKADQALDQAQSKSQEIQQGALKVADTTGKVFWGVFGALALGLISSILGAITGVSRRQRAWAAGTPVGVGAPRREVYP
jgi:hypothetical protein